MPDPNPYDEFRGMPHMDRDKLPQPTGLSPAEKTKILLILLHSELGTSNFQRLIDDCATHMEVFGVIDSADRAKTMAKTLSSVDAQRKAIRRQQFMCEELAAINGDEIVQEIARYTERIQELRSQLYAAYEEQASTTLASIVEEARRRSLNISHACGDRLHATLKKISEG